MTEEDFDELWGRWPTCARCCASGVSCRGKPVNTPEPDRMALCYVAYGIVVLGEDERAPAT
jgi:hypothetical protein